jgi:superfamily II DNA or RNA helicase
MAVFYKDYEKQSGNIENTGYDITPTEFHNLLGIGLSVYDEVHKALNLVYKSISYSHTSLILGLSATMESLNTKVEDIQHLMFPNTIRFDEIKMKKYIELLSIKYEFMVFNPKRIRTTMFGSNMYNDIAFEHSICNNPSLLKSYLEMQFYIMRHLFKGGCDFYQPGDKAIVFASSVKMCTHLTEYLQEKYPELDIRRYAENDPYENLMEADVRVTTIKSGSTGHDIPGLTYCQMTSNIQSIVANKQARGRLREIVGRNLRFCYTYCGQVDRHVEYNKSRLKMFADGVKSIKELTIPFKLR